MANVKIDCTQIPRVQMDILCRTLLAGIERFYSDPENLRRYEVWLRHADDSTSSSIGCAVSLLASLCWQYWRRS